MNDDLDPYLASLFRPDFPPPGRGRDDVCMTDEMPISQEQLAKEAGRWFAGAVLADIPAKLWLDCYAAGNQFYLRATFDGGLRQISIVRLAGMATALDERFGTELVPVCYPEDYTWEEIEERNRALNRVP